MNYLAHAYLSFNDPEVLTGNMISDFVKGKKRFDFSEKIQKGIMLHRDIDTFTDTHPVTKKAKEFFKPQVGLYAGAFVDVVYDHFLARDTKEFNHESLLKFSLFAYEALEEHKDILPAKFANMLPYMRRDNWLYNYSTLKGIENSFAGLTRRAKYLDNSAPAFESFLKNFQALQDCYNSFFTDVKSFAFNKFSS
jgi:acyl carrier protein phosphodiesterase